AGVKPPRIPATAKFSANRAARRQVPEHARKDRQVPQVPSRRRRERVKRFRPTVCCSMIVQRTAYFGRHGGIIMTQALWRPIALVVEANGEERALVSTLLEESEMHVIECDSAEAALAVVERKGDQMAMVFTDVGLAGRMNGIDLARSLDAHHPDLAVLVTSAQPAPPA